MSRAFVSEEAEEARAAMLPERPVSLHPNLVTPSGLAQIEAALASLRAELAEVAPDDDARPRLLRDLRYWQARHTTAQLVEPPGPAPQEVAFGVLVSIRRGGGAISQFRIVGEDEADPAQARLSYVAPLAVALQGAGVGETVEQGGGREPVQVVAIEG
ncbi:GreA/GreB family elongation factor [Lichenicola sp.]|uniref:GreA/GreB family elongation factor n=1 Tax=Lichenicola sp. TaxID=2804529 RepID=UPI003AFF9272